MKNYIESCYPDLPSGRQRTYDQLREIVQEAWDSITIEVLRDLINSMSAKCQAVIEADGGHTKY